jgi:type IV pilus assembly protein PilA
MVCSQCGQAISEGAAFCPTCGHQTGFANAGFAGLPVQTSTATPRPVTLEKTSGLAIASLIFGILFLFFPLPVLAVVFGHISLSQIKKSAGRLGGRGMAIAGLVLGYMGIAFVPLILIVAAIAIPNLLRARIAANEASAVAAIKEINTAQVTYQDTYQNVGYSSNLQTLGGAEPCTPSPATACLINNRLALANTPPGRSGYVFSVGRSADGSQYVASAVPVQHHQTGNRSFCSTEDGTVRVDPNGNAIPNNEVCALLSPID